MKIMTMRYPTNLAGQFFYILLRMAKRIAYHPFFKSMIYAAHNKANFESVWEHEKMIADRTRIDSYHAAIMRQVKDGDAVVDLGTGTGILAMFAAQKNPSRIYAIDHGGIINSAKHLATSNGIDNIEFMQMHSRNFHAADKVDVIIHEQIGNHLFEENMIDNVCDLRDRMLREGGRIIPGKFELFIEPVSLKDEFRVPFLFQNRDVHGIDFYSMTGPTSGADGPDGRSGPHLRVVKTTEVDKLLCKPEKIMSLDLMKVDPKNLPSRYKVKKTIVHDGMIDGLYLYFRVIFDDELHFDTSPLSRATHWLGSMFRVEVQRVRSGDVIECDWNMVDITNIRTWTLDYTLRSAADVQRHGDGL